MNSFRKFFALILIFSATAISFFSCILNGTEDNLSKIKIEILSQGMEYVDLDLKYESTGKKAAYWTLKLFENNAEGEENSKTPVFEAYMISSDSQRINGLTAGNEYKLLVTAYSSSKGILEKSELLISTLSACASDITGLYFREGFIQLQLKEKPSVFEYQKIYRSELNSLQQEEFENTGTLSEESAKSLNFEEIFSTENLKPEEYCFKDKKVKNNTVYAYKCCAFDESKLLFTGNLMFIKSKVKIPEKIQNLNLEEGLFSITAKWDPEEDIDHYLVSYTVNLKDKTLSGEKIVENDSFYVFRNEIQRGANLYVTVAAVNEGGTGIYSDTVNISLNPIIKEVNLTASQTTAEFTYSVGSDYVEENVQFDYEIRTGSETGIKVSDENLVVTDNRVQWLKLEPEKAYSSFDAKSYFMITAHTDSEENKEKIVLVKRLSEFFTDGFSPVNQDSIEIPEETVASDSLIINFDDLSEEEKCGLSSNLEYVIVPWFEERYTFTEDEDLTEDSLEKNLNSIPPKTFISFYDIDDDEEEEFKVIPQTPETEGLVYRQSTVKFVPFNETVKEDNKVTVVMEGLYSDTEYLFQIIVRRRKNPCLESKIFSSFKSAKTKVN